MKRLYIFILMAFVGMQASSDSAIYVSDKSTADKVKTFLKSTKGKLTIGALCLGGIGGGVGLGYYLFHAARKNNDAAAETKKDKNGTGEPVKSDVWLQEDGSIHISTSEKWHNATPPFSLPKELDGLAGHLVVFKREVAGIGRCEFRLCVFNRTHQNVFPIKKLQETYSTSLENWAKNAELFNNEKSSIALEFYTGSANDYIAKKSNVQLKYHKKLN